MPLKHMLMYHVLFAPDTGDGAGDTSAPPVDPPPAPTEDPPQPVTFTQEQVNAMLARERNTATRKASKASKAAPPPQELTPPADTTALTALTEQVQALTGLVQGTIDKQTESESEKAYAADVAGLELTDTDTAMLKSLKEHAPEVYATKLAEFKAVDQPPAPKGPGLAPSPGAPAPSPNAPDPMNPIAWTGDDVASMQTAGNFRENLQKARNAMPGGRGGLFPAKG